MTPQNLATRFSAPPSPVQIAPALRPVRDEIQEQQVVQAADSQSSLVDMLIKALVFLIIALLVKKFASA